MRYQIAIRPDAKLDVKRILETDRESGIRIANWLQSIREDQGILDRLSDEGFDDGEIDVKSIQCLQRKCLNVWRVKITGTDKWVPYRILYVFDHSKHIYHVLRVVARKDYNYKMNDPITEGCINAIRKLGIPDLPRG